MRVALICLMATIVLWPAAYIAASVVAALALLIMGRASPRSLTLGVAVIPLMLIPLFTQLISGLWIVPDDPLQNVAVEGLRIDRESGDNLLSNSDLSWLQSWRAPADEGAYALGVEPGFWQLTTFRHGAQFNEVRSWQEVPIEAGQLYTLNAVVRHDGNEFGADVVFRTRDGWQGTETELREIGPGVVRLSSTLQPLDEPTRLRTLHLATLTGDWSQVEIGLATLRPGALESDQRFSSHNAKVSWQEGIQWLVGTAVVLFATALLAPHLLRNRHRSLLLIGFNLGLGVQLLVAVFQLIALESSRSAGTLPHPNLLAHGALATVALIVTLSNGDRKHAMAALLTGGATIWLSGSDAGILVFIIYIAVLVALQLRRYAGLLRIAALGGIGLAAVLFVAYSVIGDPLSGSNTVARMQAWKTALDLTAAHPVAGVGFGNFGFHHEFTIPDNPGPVYRAYHAHSVLGVAAEFGLPTLASMVALIGWFLRRALRAGANLALAAIAIVMAVNLVDFTITNPVVLLPAWIVCLSVFWPGSHDSTAPPPVPVVRRNG